MISDHLIYYNYFNDVNFDYLDKAFNLENRVDTDKKSAKLYDSFYHCFFENFYKYPTRKKNIKISSWKTKDDFGYSFYVEDCDDNYKQSHILSMDYIGPSIFQAKDIAEMTDDEIKSFLKISRTLGGHIVWERGLGTKQTVNQAKGGSKGVVDRIDWTLLLLKIWYESGTDKTILFSKVKTLIRLEEKEQIVLKDINRINEIVESFEASKDWLRLIGDFKSFSDFFKLTGSFVDKQYDVIELTDFFPIIPTKYGYRRYIENNINAIERRNKNLIK